MIDFVPSHNVEIEQAIIGCCLQLGKSPTIPPEAFYRDAHQKVVGILQGMERQNKAIDLLTAWETLSAKNLIESVGGAAYLAACMDEVSKPENLAVYETHIMKHFQKRRLQTQALQIGSLAGEVSPEKAVEWIAELEIAVNECSRNDGAQTVTDGLKALIIDLDEKQTSGGGLLGLSTGLSDLDHYLSGMCQSDLIVLAGRPGMGKTALATAITANVVRNAHKVLFFSLEMDRKQLLYRMVSQLSGLDLQKLRSGSLTKDEYYRANTAMQRASTWPLLIDDRPALNEMAIVAETKKHLPDLAIIDYLGFMKCSQKFDRKDLEIAHITGSLKALAKELSIPVLLLCQLNRKVEERTAKERRPLLSDLRDSGSIEQDADVVLFIYNDQKTNPDTLDAGISEIIIGKHRNGPTGIIPVGFRAHCTAFSDLAREDIESFWRRRKKHK